jgi:uncharacterized membrane protein
MATPTPGRPSTDLGLEPNVAGLLCYVPCCIGLVFSVVAAIVEKQSRFARFHAFQSLLVHGVLVVLCIPLMVVHLALSFAGLGIVSFLVQLVMWLSGAVVILGLVFLMVKANGGEEFELPVIGPIARRWV